MPRQQQLLKLFMRLMLPVSTLGGFGSIAGLLLVFSNTSRIVSTEWSSDRHYRATVSEVFGSAGCGRANSSVVTVERSNFHFYTGQFSPFCLDGTPDHIAIKWINANTLAIECKRCEGEYAFADQNWGKLRFVYDLDKP